MKAEETVMSNNQIGDMTIPCINPFLDAKKVAETQAKISFKAGIREAITWAKQYHGFDFLQAIEQFKEWGIDG